MVIDEVRRSQARPCEVAAAEANPKLGATGDETSGIAVANQALRQAVDDLSAAHPQVLHEIFFRNRTVDEVAADLGIPVGTVRSRVHYAQRALRVAVIEG